ncbi:IS3 family transposase [Desulfobacter vibrioformis]|uniref:IS3 family transposase n=1 Tax=Desulfobacter vibrioformis TaxID=34031 RepID=UPI000A019DCB|nr:IS3 family transposase [Desulfobacter vibrioformis]
MTESVADRRLLVDKKHPEISITKQCELLQISKGVLYYKPKPVDSYTLTLMDLLDEQHTRTPFYGSRRLTAYLNALGHPVNRKRVQRLMKLMRIEAIYPKPKTLSPKRPKEGIGFIALRMNAWERAAYMLIYCPHASITGYGARVASQHCPIFRAGERKISYKKLASKKRPDCTRASA